MGSGNRQAENRCGDDPSFATTRWSLVLAVGRRKDPSADSALAELCQAYWYPLYSFVRRQIADVHAAQDLTQAFFERLLEAESIADADPDRGRFRAFLLTACKRFLINQWHKARAEKRGGRRRQLSLDFDSGESRYVAEAVDTLTPERLYEQQWAITLLARVLDRLKEEHAQKDKLAHFEQLKAFLSGSQQAGAYARTAKELGISQSAAKVAAHRLRNRYRELLRDEIAQTVACPEEIDDEIRNLFEILGAQN